MKIANADSLIPKVMQINCAARRNMACSRLEDKRIRDYIVLHCNPLSGIALHRFTRWRARSANEISVQLLRTRPPCLPPSIPDRYQSSVFDHRLSARPRIAPKETWDSGSRDSRNAPLYHSRSFDRFTQEKNKKRKKTSTERKDSPR